MKRLLFALAILGMICAVTGCGGGNSRNFTVKEILSDETVDGYIVEDPATGNLTVTEVTRDLQSSVLAGIDPVSLKEYRAFLYFPLQNVVPGRANIESASLDIFVRSILPRNGIIPIRLELVSFTPPLAQSDFDRQLLPALAAVTIFPSINATEVGEHVVIDVTHLMDVAQSLGLADFQVRVMEDPGALAQGLIEIDDSSSDTAPLLRVRYF
jgi:hypothetical protein